MQHTKHLRRAFIAQKGFLTPSKDAMGAVLGLAAWGRTREKLNGANNGGLSVPTGSTATPSLPAPVSAPTPIAKPMPKVAAPVEATVELEPGDPPTRNTRND